MTNRMVSLAPTLDTGRSGVTSAKSRLGTGTDQKTLNMKKEFPAPVLGRGWNTGLGQTTNSELCGYMYVINIMA